MADKSKPTTISNLPYPENPVAYDFAIGLWQRIAFSLAWGSPAFDEFSNADDKAAFAQLVASGRFFEDFEELKRGCLFHGVPVPDEIMGEFLSLDDEKPLADDKRAVWEPLGKVAWAIAARLEVEEIIAERGLRPATAAAPLAAVPPANSHNGFTHAIDFASITCPDGTIFRFTSAQCPAIELLWQDAVNNRGGGVKGETLRDASGTDSKSIRDVFRSGSRTHESWGTLIRNVGKSIYKLELSENWKSPLSGENDAKPPASAQ